MFDARSFYSGSTVGGLQLVDKFFVVAQVDEIVVLNDEVVDEGYTPKYFEVVVIDDVGETEVRAFTNLADTYVMSFCKDLYVVSQSSGSTTLEVTA